MLTVPQAARLLDVTPAAVRQWIRRGHIRRNRRGLIDNHDLLAWWERRDHAKARRVASAA